MCILTREHLQDEASAFKWVEAHVWPDGPVCPQCGGYSRIYALNGVRTKPSKRHPKGLVRHGLKKCGHCGSQFTVRVGTIFEDSHIPLHLWLQAIVLLCGSKKGISSNQLARTLDLTLKSAWFLSHRIREMMRDGPLAPPLGGAGGIVEADETYIGRKPGRKKGKSHTHKQVALTLVERGGRARSFQIDKASTQNIEPIIANNIAHESAVMTDQARWHRDLHRIFGTHESVDHSREEYVRGTVHTNTVEGYFSIFKRGMKGVYQHCSEKHLHRYLAEFDFRYSNRVRLGVNDEQRAAKALRQAKGKRLTYRTTNGQVSRDAKAETPRA